MTHVPHELAEEFPSHADRIHALKSTDTHFSRLYDEYHTINRAVHRAETNVEPLDALSEVNLRKRRATLKDELYAMLTE